ncbi:hypothetical protein NQZ68_024416 [Dissostichus eleginoides]|nr:hypothetical protein NQZ68_024416 [Dissostichus eleginoides]
MHVPLLPLGIMRCVRVPREGRVGGAHAHGRQKLRSRAAMYETLTQNQLRYSGDRACFEHSNFFKVNALDPAGHSVKSIEEAPRGRGWDRRYLALRRTVSSIPRSNYELFNCSNFKIRYWSWNYRGCWHQTCPQMDPR